MTPFETQVAEALAIAQGARDLEHAAHIYADNDARGVAEQLAPRVAKAIDRAIGDASLAALQGAQDYRHCWINAVAALRGETP